METIQMVLEKMERQLSKWSGKLDELAFQADQDGDEAKAAYRKGINKLKSKRQFVQAKLEELRTTSTENWESIQAKVDKIWSELEQAVKEFIHGPHPK